MKPLYATLEDRMLGRTQRDLTDEEKKDTETYYEYVRDSLAKYVGRKNTPALRNKVVADLLDLAHEKAMTFVARDALEEKKR
jgi:DNA transposition AAA+ family ATPase